MSVDLSSAQNVELGVGLGKGDTLELFSLPIQDDVGSELVEMYGTTLSNWNGMESEPREFNPSEKPASSDKLTWPNTEEACPTAFRCYATGTIDPIEDLVE